MEWGEEERALMLPGGRGTVTYYHVNTGALNNWHVLIAITLWPPHDQVGDVPEFRAGRQKLRALEDRLQVSADGHLGGGWAVPPLWGLEGGEGHLHL